MRNVQPQALLDKPVYDSEHHKVGKIKQLYLDENTQEPTWAAVSTGGIFSSKESMLPLDATHMEEEGLIVDLPAEAIKEAPTVDADQELTTEDQETLLNFYNAVFLADRKQQMPSQTGSTGMTDDMSDDNDNYDDQHTSGQSYTDMATSGQQTDNAMTRSEERLHIDKEQRERARLRLKKYIVTEHQTVEMPVKKEKLRLEREPITDENRDAAMSGPNLSEAEHEITLKEEVPRVHKETVPIERVRMTKDTVDNMHTEDRKIRKEQLGVERVDKDDTTSNS